MGLNDESHGLAAGYAELAYAILLWQLHHESGTRSQQIEAERHLTILADSLRAVGYDVKRKQ